MRLALSSAEFARLQREGVPWSEGRRFLLVEPLLVQAELATVETSEEISAPLSAEAFVFALPQAGALLLVGRGADADISLNDSAVSKRHLSIRADGENLRVWDEGSHNGTMLNGVRLGSEATALKQGDVLEIAGRYRATLMDTNGVQTRIRAAEDPRTLDGDARSSEDGLLSGKVAVITGGGRGLGRAYALRFAREGCRVVVNDIGAPPFGAGRDESVAEAVVAEIVQAKGTAIASTHDVSVRAEVEALFDLAEQRFGGVDIVLCSAGTLYTGSGVAEIADEEWEQSMSVNARGTFLCVQAAARSMLAHGRRGRIITTGSMVGMQGSAGLGAYAASKAAIYALSRTAALELAPHGITVNMLTPMAWTRLTQAVPAIAAIPDAEHALSPAYVADVAVFLASDLSDEVTGQVVDVGGPQLSLYTVDQTIPLLPSRERWTPQELARRWREVTGA